MTITFPDGLDQGVKINYEQKGQLLRTGTTDSNGQINWENLKSGNYILVEMVRSSPYMKKMALWLNQV
ncbi:prealbumin-like fold domain-containing protein [Oenococcus oeni]|uniref:prealbumin-like fold domain-containing protein n=1 Tax=Oenococcus oeni TaxID=1247 RepID=UPI00148B0825|nr:prealbumin-like fold domain-containing protein [Oenococcus oeni]QJU68990.1 prealbumin-like fold domain-containing protein [Oenococcus oeni]